MARYDGDIASRLVSDLQRDFGLSRAQAAGIVGNLAHESGGFKTLQETSPMVKGSRGGYGYAQWTGSRRKDFESWAAKKGLATNTYAANYGFLKHELTKTPEKAVLSAVKAAKTATEAAKAFSKGFLRPGIPHTANRVALAKDIEAKAQTYGVPVPTFKDAQVIGNPPVPGLLGRPETLANVAGQPSDTLYAPNNLEPGVPAFGVPVPSFKDASYVPSISGPYAAPAQNFDVAGNIAGTTYAPTIGIGVTNLAKPVSRNAPVGKVERAALTAPTTPAPSRYASPAAQAGQYGQYQRAQAPATPSQMANAPRGRVSPEYSAPPASVAPSRANMAAMAAQYGQYSRAPGQPTTTAPSETSRQAAAYGQLANSATQVGVGNLAGTRQFEPLLGTPIAPPAIAPPQIAPPVAPPATPPVRTPVQPPDAVTTRAISAPTVSAPPAATGLDVWGGRAQTGIATNGSTLSRNPDGTVSLTSSKYGWTETMNPDGSYRSTNAPGFFGIDAAANKALGGIKGPTGGIGINAPSPSMSRAQLGQAARGMAGAMAGSMIGGSFLGPLGSIAGAQIGRSLAQGKSPFGGLAPGMTVGPRGAGGFPAAPSSAGTGGDGALTAFGEAAARGEYGAQAGYAANNPGRGLW